MTDEFPPRSSKCVKLEVTNKSGLCGKLEVTDKRGLCGKLDVPIHVPESSSGLSENPATDIPVPVVETESKKRKAGRKKKIEQEVEQINLFKLSQRLISEQEAFSFAQVTGLLPTIGFCPICGQQTKKVHVKKRPGCPSHHQFSCVNDDCIKTKRHQITVKKGTWFADFRMPIQKVLVLTYCFAHKFSSSQAIHESSLGKELTSAETVADFYSYCREVCSEYLYTDKHKETPRKIGGVNCVVEISSGKFGKRNLKRTLPVGQWILGGVCRETRDSFLVPIEDRSDKTLLALVERNVEKGSVVITDSSTKAYNQLESLGYSHVRTNNGATVAVNGSSSRPTSQSGGIDTNTAISSTWWEVRQNFPCNSWKNNVALHLSEYLWRRKTSGEDPYVAFVNTIKTVYSGSQAQSQH